MTSDISNTTIAILLVLTILVSIVGTWTVLDAAKQVKPAPTASISPHSTAAGYVQLKVDAPPQQYKTSGKVSVLVFK